LQRPTARPRRPRHEARAERRRQLIDATINCIARKGLGGMTLSDVAREAGLSQGIVNLHFDSKDNLLAETLRHLAEEYGEQFTKALDKAPDAPAAKLLAILEMDLKPALCDRRKLAVWFAFWGEVRAVPTYQKICQARDQKNQDVIEGLVGDIIDEGDYPHLDAHTVAEALAVMTDGMWLSYLVNPKTFSRAEALAAIRSTLRAFFPDHYR